MQINKRFDIPSGTMTIKQKSKRKRLKEKIEELVKNIIETIKFNTVEIWNAILWQIIVPTIVSVITAILTIRIWRG